MKGLGQFHTLPVARLTDFGAFLSLPEGGDILLPKRFVADDLAVGDFIRVFVYLDSEDRPVATTETPKAQVGKFALLEATAITRVGAFLDWGLGKELLVPFAEQQRPMEEGKRYLVYVFVNDQDGRIVASSKLDKFLDKYRPRYEPGQPVDLIIGSSTDLGFKAIVNHSHWGVLFESEVFQRVSFGQQLKGFIKRVRPDGKIDLTLQHKSAQRDQLANKVMAYVAKQGGFARLHDKSTPEEISRALGMSKAAFKRTIGSLYKAGELALESDGIRATGKQA
ncbi:S1-like domain-containing RNA-binding protein [Simiduia sp. 21SJ11W-1]|uniref:CvfB family protein n=1 Tax=Simiduia sp. 21SJ11W-1 TaxID=2909669 RepID=UPI00209FC030|nr:S1-like domain-containing RNA-binding protein [Simiduia sp. 21SJ11W-1]UTA48839.1 S1-like domain-containing RNA-binding protein [Simiduia sp. 21SJ11W-1]